ncbi:hypothetical protein BH23GEM7_BH23GEM7_27290 [soil metagenome]|jgi:hypothetical protein
MDTERRLLAEQSKLQALRQRIRETAYMKSSEVRAHLQMSRATLEALPFPVLPYVPGTGTVRVERRYHPRDVAAFPARARRWRNAVERGKGDEVLEQMQREIEERDQSLMDEALRGFAA